ncbi:hypothetical protein EJ08DRAFT_691794 [Tothia fuscella]|uniref:F-box domain-containing protein n=1 Tax=Tothia fuscella TaxID=1048955 RepID=A0A9P4P3F9_9PEZI|nr:hypothetical protein EJ08DRAFT_691794 [Tothia fuscella]
MDMINQDDILSEWFSRVEPLQLHSWAFEDDFPPTPKTHDVFLLPEILANIFKHMDLRTLFVCQRVNKTFQDIINNTTAIKQRLFMIPGKTKAGTTVHASYDYHLKWVEDFPVMNTIVQLPLNFTNIRQGNKSILYCMVCGHFEFCDPERAPAVRYVDRLSEEHRAIYLESEYETPRYIPSFLDLRWNDPFLNVGASWRNLQVSDPPVYHLTIRQQVELLGSRRKTATVAFPNGLTMGELSDHLNAMRHESALVRVCWISPAKNNREWVRKANPEIPPPIVTPDTDMDDVENDEEEEGAGGGGVGGDPPTNTPTSIPSTPTTLPATPILTPVDAIDPTPTTTTKVVEFAELPIIPQLTILAWKDFTHARFIDAIIRPDPSMRDQPLTAVEETLLKPLELEWKEDVHAGGGEAQWGHSVSTCFVYHAPRDDGLNVFTWRASWEGMPWLAGWTGR